MMPLPQLPSAHPPPRSSSLQVIEDRYIDEDKLLNICKQKFGAGNYHLRVSELLKFLRQLCLFLATLVSRTLDLHILDFESLNCTDRTSSNSIDGIYKLRHGLTTYVPDFSIEPYSSKKHN
jgi:hypothetical protein